MNDVMRKTRTVAADAPHVPQLHFPSALQYTCQTSLVLSRGGTTPLQKITGNVPDISRLIPFGQRVVVHAPKASDRRGNKLPHTHRGEVAYMLEYVHTGSYDNYRLLTERGTVVTSVDVDVDHNFSGLRLPADAAEIIESYADTDAPTDAHALDKLRRMLIKKQRGGITVFANEAAAPQQGRGQDDQPRFPPTTPPSSPLAVPNPLLSPSETDEHFLTGDDDNDDNSTLDVPCDPEPFMDDVVIEITENDSPSRVTENLEKGHTNALPPELDGRPRRSTTNPHADYAGKHPVGGWVSESVIMALNNPDLHSEFDQQIQNFHQELTHITGVPISAIELSASISEELAKIDNLKDVPWSQLQGYWKSMAQTAYDRELSAVESTSLVRVQPGTPEYVNNLHSADHARAHMAFKQRFGDEPVLKCRIVKNVQKCARFFDGADCNYMAHVTELPSLRMVVFRHDRHDRALMSVRRCEDCLSTI